VKGLIKEKEEAKKEYKENLEKGNLVAYSEIKEESPDIMKIDIGNIPPLNAIKITFVYSEELEVSVNKFWKYKIPSTITPRYCNDTSEADKDSKTIQGMPTIPSSSHKVIHYHLHFIKFIINIILNFI
jgi:hypothetical protein